VAAICPLLAFAAPADSLDAFAVEKSDLVHALQARNESRDGRRYFADITDFSTTPDSRSPAAPAYPSLTPSSSAASPTSSGARDSASRGEDAPGSIQVAFDDERALWHTVHVHIAVAQVVFGDLSTGTTAVVGSFSAPQRHLSGLAPTFSPWATCCFS